MKTTLLSIIALTICTFTYGYQNAWRNPRVNAINRAPMHSNFFAYESAEMAAINTKEYSSNYLSINGLWKFNWVENYEDRPTDFFSLNYSDQYWDEIQVPGIWELNGYGDAQYVNIGYAWRNQFNHNPPYVPTERNHVGSYRRVIELPSNWDGKDIYAHFGSVTSNIYLWVNGKFVGYSEDSKLEAEFDLTRYLKSGKNLIAFQVYRWSDGTYLEDQDFFRFSGVGRDCYLYAREKNHLEDIRITPDLDADYNNGWIDVELNKNSKIEAELVLTDAKGKVIAKETSVASKVRIEVNSPQKWSAESPYLYTLTTTVNREVIPQKVGFRKIELDKTKGQVLINGKAVLFKGVNRHELNPDKGYYLSREDMLRDIKTMKELNINAVRTCHYPNANIWYDLCDEYGIYVVAEANIESHGMGYGKETLAKRADYKKAHLERNQRNVQRGFNHPSIIFWSLGNEAGDGESFVACYEWIKQEDTSRPVQYEQAALNSHTDIYAPMYATYEWSEEFLNRGDKRPLIQCEYAHAMGNSLGGFKEYWDLIRKYPNYQGGFIWDFADQSLRWKGKNGIDIWAYGGDFNDYDASDNNFCNNGLVNPDREWNPHAIEAKYFHQNIWTTPVDLKKGEIEIYNENFFVDLSNYILEWSIFLNGVEMERGVIPHLTIAPQNKAIITLPYNLSGMDEGEILLNVTYKTRCKEGLLSAGYTAAYEQLSIQPYIFESMSVNNSNTNVNIDNSDKNFLRVEGENFTVDFNRRNGYLCRYIINNKNYIEADGVLKPNFWRAVTDNDLGGEVITATKNYLIWREPQIVLNDLKHKIDSGRISIEASYSIEAVKAKLHLNYQISSDGTIIITQRMDTAEGEAISDMFRFGMQVTLISELELIKYYGRGPGENYTDRNNGTKIGYYEQSVEEQYYPYIRPQESGAKTDIRWWKLLNTRGEGIEIFSDQEFIATARNYSQTDLDDGEQKEQRHSAEIPHSNCTELSLDKVQMGLGCVNSWGALPQEKYRVEYNDYKFTFAIRPINTIYCIKQ